MHQPSTTFDALRRHTNIEHVPDLLDAFADRHGLDPLDTKAFAEFRRLRDLADTMRAEAMATRRPPQFDAAGLAKKVIDGTLTPSEAASRAQQFHEQEKLHQLTRQAPAARGESVALAISRHAATAAQSTLNEGRTLAWLRPVVTDNLGVAHQLADRIDTALGHIQRPHQAGVRVHSHPYAPTGNELNRKPRLRRDWESLLTPLENLLDVADLLATLRAHDLLPAPQQPARRNVWSQIWATIPEGSFTPSKVQPDTMREFFRASRHQHTIELLTAAKLDAAAEEIPDDRERIANKIAQHRQFEQETVSHAQQHPRPTAPQSP